MTRSQKAVTILALLAGLLTGGVCTQAAYWVDACVGSESGGYGASPGWRKLC